MRDKEHWKRMSYNPSTFEGLCKIQMVKDLQSDIENKKSIIQSFQSGESQVNNKLIRFSSSDQLNSDFGSSYNGIKGPLIDIRSS